MADVHPSAIVYPGTVLGEGVKVLEGAVVGKQPTLSPRSTAKREELPPATLGDGTIVSTGAIVFAGSRIGARVIVGDQACIRERVEFGEVERSQQQRLIRPAEPGQRRRVVEVGPVGGGHDGTRVEEDGHDERSAPGRRAAAGLAAHDRPTVERQASVRALTDGQERQIRVRVLVFG